MSAAKMPGRTRKNRGKTLEESQDFVDEAEEGSEASASDANISEAGDILQAIHSLKNELGMKLDTALQTLQSDFGQRLDTVLETVQSVQGDFNIFSGRLTEAEERLGRAEDGVVRIEKTAEVLQRTVEKLTAKVDDLENRSRRSNLRLIGLPENAEGRDVCSFLEKWIPETLGKESFQSPLVIERAHRVPSFRANPNAPPRALVMKFLNFRDKVQVINAARAKGDVLFGTHRIRFFPDQSDELRKKCRAFDGVKAKFRERGARYGLLYPAILLVTVGGRRYTFKTPAEAEKFLQSRDNLAEECS